MEAIIESSKVFYFDWELDLLHWFQSIHNGFLDFIVPKITFLGNAGWFWIVLTALLLILPFNRKMGLQATISLILTFTLCNLILKPSIMRCRPCWLEQDVQMLVKIPHDFSFPSGHSNASFAVATAIFTRNKKLGIPALILAAMIAISRLYLFVHWPTDVLAGTCIGICGGIISYFIINYFSKKYKKA
jgi:undecaprenyl-diphosphatase